MSNELAVIKKLELVPFFTKGAQVDETLSAIEKEVLAFVGDPSTDKGRKAITAMVTKVTKSKTYLESKGKALAAEYKEIPKAIDATRKQSKDFLTELQAKVRQPLTDWEAEQAAIEAAKVEAKRIEDLNKDHEIGLLLDEKFNAERDAAIKAQQEADEKARIAHDAAIAKEAKEKAEAEARQREADLIQQKKDAEAKAERDRLAAIEREKELERQRIESEERRKIEAENAKRLAEQQAKRAEEQRLIDAENARLYAEQQAENARQAEIKRQQDEADLVEAERLKAERNRDRAALVHNEMMNAAIAGGVEPEQAKAFIKLLAKCKIPHIGTIQY